MIVSASKDWEVIRRSRQAIANVVRGLGVTCRRAGELLRCSASTVSRWMRHATDWPSRRPGRPALRADRLARNDVYATLTANGGCVCADNLKAAHPELGRAELRRLARRWRKVQARRHRRGLEQLEWQRAGAVWAMDFGEVPGGVEDFGSHVLVVRDLASGVVLAADVHARQAADSVIRTLCRLFVEHGAPLVLKADNGSAFVSGAVQGLLAEHGVLPLYSPPGTPAYNGGCEASVGSVKARAVALAGTRGGDAQVAVDDLQAALAQIASRPIARRADTPTRRQTWLARAPIRAALRQDMLARVERLRAVARDARGLAGCGELSHALRASIDRFAIGRALRDLRFLTSRRADFAA